MNYFLLCFIVFVCAYTLNILYITVFYHRALAHGAITLHPVLKTIVIHSGNWVTGLDPKGWVCMHRMHHLYSDTEKDPHSPVVGGIWNVLPLQLRSYKKTLAGLMFDRSSYTSTVKDMDFPVSWINQKQLWYLPYVFQLAVALLIGFFFHAWILAGCYWFGMMSHPLQGWMVNALAHHYGYRNFDTPDHSKNNSMVAWLVFGEGFQNNHHYAPSSAKFSVKPWEVDLGYGLCRFLACFGFVQLKHSS